MLAWWQQIFRLVLDYERTHSMGFQKITYFCGRLFILYFVHYLRARGKFNSTPNWRHLHAMERWFNIKKETQHLDRYFSNASFGVFSSRRIRRLWLIVHFVSWFPPYFDSSPASRRSVAIWSSSLWDDVTSVSSISIKQSVSPFSAFTASQQAREVFLP